MQTVKPMFAASNSSDQMRPLFHDVLNRIVQIARDSGIQVISANETSWERYRGMTADRRLAALDAAQTYLKICEQMVVEKRPLTDSRMLLWTSLRHFNLIPRSDMLNSVTDDMVVELYGATGTQLFRNLKFLEVCSYTMADIFIHPWFELFERNDEMTQDSVKCVSMVMRGEVPTPEESIFTKSHRIVEAFSDERLEIEMRFHMLSPVHTKGVAAPAGFIATSTASIVGQRQPMAAINPLSAELPSLV